VRSPPPRLPPHLAPLALLSAKSRGSKRRREEWKRAEGVAREVGEGGAAQEVGKEVVMVEGVRGDEGDGDGQGGFRAGMGWGYIDRIRRWRPRTWA
jgi:hypothetical protein